MAAALSDSWGRSAQHLERIPTGMLSIMLCNLQSRVGADMLQRVQRTHVNLVDLTESPHTGEKAEIFPTVEALREYTLETRKFFPRNEAHAGGLLKTLLRQILAAPPPKSQAKQPARKRVDSGVDLSHSIALEGNSQSIVTAGSNTRESRITVARDGSIIFMSHRV